jgi:hypothetical protein
MRDLRWIAAIHRNTRHHHVHLVLAGMHEVAGGVYRRVDVSKPRLAAMKQTVGLEIERQRRERAPSKAITPRVASGLRGRDSVQLPARQRSVVRPALIRALPLAPLASYRVALNGARRHYRPSAPAGSMLALRTAARRYQRRMQHELEAEARRLGWEHAA